MGYEGRCGAELRVDETTIPTVNSGARVELSTDGQAGSSDITKIGICEMPYEWNGVDYKSKVDDFDPETQSSYSLATIFFEDVRRKTWNPVMRGFVRGVKPTNTLGTAKVYVSSPDALLTAVPFSASYTQPSVKQVFEDVADTFRSETVFNPTVRGVTPRRLVTDSEGDVNVDYGDSAVGPGSVADYGEGNIEGQTGDDESGQTVADSKTFQNNQSSCASALNWATENSGGRYYFEFRHGDTHGLSLVYDDGSDVINFTQRENRGAAQQQQLKDGGSFPDIGPKEVDVINNAALHDTFQINTMTAKGKTGVSIGGWEFAGPFSEKYPQVRVQYDPFVSRAGGNVVGETIEVGSVTLESTENTAKKKLEQTIRDTGVGTIELYGNPFIKPTDLVTAVPECGNVLTTSVKPITYSISEVIHEKSAHEEYRTKIKVSPKFDPNEMSVVNSEMKDV